VEPVRGSKQDLLLVTKYVVVFKLFLFVTYFTTLSVPRLYKYNVEWYDRIIGSGRSPRGVPPRNLLEGTEESHEKPVNIVGVSTEILTVL
jgi:hypothetical protein